jgi:flavin-binding protein dodecin
MPDRTYKLVEIVGSSETSVHQAVQNAITRAAASLKGLGWFEVTQIRGRIKDGDVTEFQVTVKIGFRIMDADEVKKAGRKRAATPAVPDSGLVGWDDHF